MGRTGLRYVRCSFRAHSVRLYGRTEGSQPPCAYSADEGQALVMAAEARNSVMNPLMDAIAQNFVCYQYEDTEPAPFRSCQWDLFFWCNDFSNTLHGYGLSGRDYSYFTLSFNETRPWKSVPRSAGGCCSFWNTAAGKPQSGCCRPAQHLVRL